MEANEESSRKGSGSISDKVMADHPTRRQRSAAIFGSLFGPLIEQPPSALPGASDQTERSMRSVFVELSEKSQQVLQGQSKAISPAEFGGPSVKRLGHQSKASHRITTDEIVDESPTTITHQDGGSLDSPSFVVGLRQSSEKQLRERLHEPGPTQRRQDYLQKFVNDSIEPESGLLFQPETRSISKEQLDNDLKAVKAVYASEKMASENFTAAYIANIPSGVVEGDNQNSASKRGEKQRVNRQKKRRQDSAQRLNKTVEDLASNIEAILSGSSISSDADEEVARDRANKLLTKHKGDLNAALSEAIERYGLPPPLNSTGNYNWYDNTLKMLNNFKPKGASVVTEKGESHRNPFLENVPAYGPSFLSNTDQLEGLIKHAKSVMEAATFCLDEFQYKSTRFDRNNIFIRRAGWLLSKHLEAMIDMGKEFHSQLPVREAQVPDIAERDTISSFGIPKSSYSRSDQLEKYLVSSLESEAKYAWKRSEVMAGNWARRDEAHQILQATGEDVAAAIVGSRDFDENVIILMDRAAISRDEAEALLKSRNYSLIDALSYPMGAVDARDVATVRLQADVSNRRAMKALVESGNDLVEAILALS